MLREAFRNLPASARPPPVAAAASAEPSMLPPPSSQPRRSTLQLQRRLAATPVVEWSLGASARRKARAAYAPPSCQRVPSPPPCRCASAHHARALAGAQSATPDAPDSYRCSSTGARSAGRALRADPQSALSPPLTSAFSPLYITRVAPHCVNALRILHAAYDATNMTCVLSSLHTTLSP